MQEKSFEILKDFAHALGKAYREQLGESVIRGIVNEKFPKKEFFVDEKGNLSITERSTAEDFTRLFEAFILRFVRDFGYDFDERLLSNIYRDIQKKYRKEEDLLLLLNTLPSGTFEKERIFKLSRQELESRILDRAKQLQEVNANLQKIVDERTKELQEANVKMEIALDRLKSLDQSKSEFIGIAAHQLRAPLSAIKWTIRLVADGDMGPLNARQKDFLERGYRVNEQMVTLINDLLDVSRIEGGRFGYIFKQINLISYLEDMANTASLDANERGVAITFQKPKEQIDMITMDPDRMRLAIGNLIDNAVKYNHRGGSVTIRLQKDRNTVDISIQDTGEGIPREEIPKLFHKFFRTENARRRQTEGTGLGLYIARVIVLRHGGDIWADSQEGAGSTFHVTLPLAAKDVPSEEEFKEKFEALEGESADSRAARYR